MDRIMSISITLLDQNFSVNDVDIMVFEPSVLFPPPQFFLGGGVDEMVQKSEVKKVLFDFACI